MIVASTIIHTLATWSIVHFIQKRFSHDKEKSTIKVLLDVDLVVLIIMTASLISAVAWSIFYLEMNIFNNFEESLYFSIVTFTTLGYGEITLGPQWRLLASIQAANGIIIFGWSTALVMSAIQKVRFS